MIRKCTTSFVLLILTLSLSGFSRPATTAAESGNPWWVWLVVLAAFAVFAGLVLWWWLYRYPEEE
jgi:hypothetical protein